MRSYRRHLLSLIVFTAILPACLSLAAQADGPAAPAAPVTMTEGPEGFAQALSLRLGELGSRAPGQEALRLSLQEGGAFLSGLPAEDAARLACEMALRAELGMRFGSSPSRAALALRRGYAEMGAQGAATASGKLERVMERIQASAAGRGSAAAAWITPSARKPDVPGPGAGR